MRVWIVNPFDPLPGEGDPPARYTYLSDALVARGHSVTWWTSSFCHRFKRERPASVVQQACRDRGFSLRLVPTPAYPRNVSLRRVHNHRRFARNFARLAREQEPPDCIVASSPPLESAWISTQLGRDYGIPTVVDTQDQWPDTLLRGIPHGLHWAKGTILSPWYRLEQSTYRAAFALSAVADGYLDRARQLGGLTKPAARFYIGADLPLLDAGLRNGAASTDGLSGSNGHADEIRLMYAGSLTCSYDVPVIIEAATLCHQRLHRPVRFIITGAGDLADDIRDMVQSKQLDNITYHGFLPMDQFLTCLASAHVAFNTAMPEALIRMPKKIFLYCAVGLAVLNSLEGECAGLISQHACGTNYRHGDVESCFAAIERIVNSTDALQNMGHAARRLAEAQFDRYRIYDGFVDFLEDLV